MYSLFFERPVLLIFLWGGLEFVLIWWWSARRTRTSGRAVRIGLAVMPVLLAVSLLVVTPAERIVAACRAIARAVDEGDIEMLAAQLAEDCTDGELDRAALLAFIEETLTRVRVDRPRLSGFAVRFESDDAGIAEFRATARIRSAEFSQDGLLTRWKLTFRRKEAEWMVVRIESIPVPPLNLRRLSHVESR